MLQFKNLNNVSDKLRDSIPTMADEVVFQMLNGHPNNDMDRDARDKEPMLYGKTQIPTYAKIKDPFANEGRGAIVEIGVPMRTENGQVLSYRPFLAGEGDGKFAGKFSLVKGKISDEELYEIFWLLNENESNPHRDKSIAPMFRIVNHKDQNQKTRNEVAILRDALDDLKGLTEKDVIEFAASQNWTETNPDELTAKVNEFGKSFPDKYLAIRKDPETKVKANIKKAFSQGKLDYDPVTGVVSMNGNELLKVNQEEKKDHLGVVAKWVNVAQNGKSVYDGIVKQLE